MIVMSLFNVFNVAASGMTAQAQRLNVVASNIANAESVTTANGQPYRGRQVVFAAIPVAGLEAGGVQVEQVVEDQSPPRIVHNPSHPFADQNGNVAMPNVNVVEEMVNMISASRSYQTSVEAMNAAKTMLLKTLTIGQ
jgi:flagellar basal-body rod protein FlgC